jgi:hypothetical protein
MLLVTALLAIQVAPSGAAPQAVGAASTPIVVEGKKEKKVCKTIDAGTGSLIGIRRFCRTADEWKMSEQQAQRIIDKEQDRQRAVQAYEQNAKNGLAKQGPM